MCVSTEYTQDAYQQAERLMLVRKAASADVDDHLSVTSGTLAKLSPPTKRTGCYLVVLLASVY